MKPLIAMLGILTISSVASAAGVTKLQSQAAAKINASATARRDGITVKPSAIKFDFLNGPHGVGFVSAKTNPGAFPYTVTIKANNGKPSAPQFKSAGKPNVDY